MQVATRKLREAYRDVKDAQLKDAYRKNLDQERQMRADKQEMNEKASLAERRANALAGSLTPSFWCHFDNVP